MKYHFATCCLLVAAATVCSGCASLPTMFSPQKAAQETPQSYAERKRDAVAAFEKQRDKAQVQAAVSCWERGEVPKSLTMLETILQRNPADVTARLRLAEIYASQTDYAAAMEHLAECVRLAPDHAEAHHTLGMILSEVAGQQEQARIHLQRACELDPENELYRAAAQEASGTSS